VFTRIDAADPQRPFAFGVYVDDDDMYAGAHQHPGGSRVCRPCLKVLSAGVRHAAPRVRACASHPCRLRGLEYQRRLQLSISECGLQASLRRVHCEPL